MDKEVLNIEICNTSSEKQVVDMFTLESLEKQTISEEIVPGDNSGENISIGASRFLIATSAINKSKNILYTYTSANGIRVYDIFERTSSNITTSTSINGDSLPSDNIRALFWNPQNELLYVAIAGTSDIWTYDINTNTALLITTGMVNSPIFIFVHNNIIYTGDNGVINEFIVKIDNGIKTNLTVPTNGDSVTSFILNAVIHESSNTLFFIQNGGGYFSLNLTTSTGKAFTTVTAVNGQQLPSNNTRDFIEINNDNVYIPNDAGVYVYNPVTNTGIVINTLTSVNGDNLPTNDVIFIIYNNTDNLLYVSGGNTNFLWRYNAITNTGEIIGLVSSGDARPTTTQSYQILVYGSLFEMFDSIFWRWDENILKKVIVNSTTIKSSESNGVSYDYITRAVQQSPIKISKIIFISENSLQKYNSLSHLINTPRGSDETYQVHFSNYVNPLLPFKQIHVELEEFLYIDFEEFLQIPIEANTCIQLLFEYTQKSPDQLMKHLVPDNKDVLPIYYDEDGKQIPAKSTGTYQVNEKTGQNKVKSMPKPEFKWLPPWIGIAIFAVLLKMKQKK